MALISEKTKKFFRGRCGQFARMEKECAGVENILWVHAASYGEFEEARPIVEEIKKMDGSVKVLATFFSPSGYEHLKNDPIADFVYYLPFDTPWNARRFLDMVRPVKAIFSISDYWMCFLNELLRRKIPTFLTSARFVDTMFYFKPLGFAYRNMFRNCFTKILVRDKRSFDMLGRIGVEHRELIGDPRMDRVLAIAAQQWRDEKVERWTKGEKVFVVGSMLPGKDEQVIAELINAHPDSKFLVIPHEVDDDGVERFCRMLERKPAVYTRTDEGFEDSSVLVVNIVGILSKLYRYGFAAYVGGGFDCAPHSIVEAAVYGIPVSYGPIFRSHFHCYFLIDAGAGKSISCSRELIDWYDSIVKDASLLEKMSSAARAYCESGRGAALKMAEAIMKN